jgi:shikimate dehydrogenase
MNEKLKAKSQKPKARVFGLIGFPLEHSFSRKFFTEKFQSEDLPDCSFENFPLKDINQFPSLIEVSPNLAGVSVTIPYKELVIPFLDELDDTAKEIGAVNSIKISEGKTKGYNTDAYGFIHSIKNLIQPFQTSALILGTGGSSKAIAYGLKRMGIEFDFVSRNPDGKELRYEDLDLDVMRHYKVVINCTPLGMFPEIDDCPPIPYEFISRSHLFFDLVYNPEETLFLKKGKEQGASIKNGFEMLQLQAERSWEIWNS